MSDQGPVPPGIIGYATDLGEHLNRAHNAVHSLAYKSDTDTAFQMWAGDLKRHLRKAIHTVEMMQHIVRFPKS